MAKAWSYEKAGVPHLKGDPSYNQKITRLIRSTTIPGVRGSATGFAALFDLNESVGVDRNVPLLVASTDGVGTKLEIARLQGRHDTIGIDLVAMCVNDIITCGAKPIFFLDYFASGKFEPRILNQVLKGITSGCRQAGCALVGGETAIMPGFYSHQKNPAAGLYDIAGFAVGVVDRHKVIDGKSIREGDILLGVASSGFHSNGYSLLRKIFNEHELRGKIGRQLLTPTRIYVRPVLELLRQMPLRGIVNITGGGLIDNLPRVIPAGLRPTIHEGNWPKPKLFDLVAESGNITTFEMMRTFNLGIGLVLMIRASDVKKAQAILRGMHLASWPVGKITRGKGVEIL
ncbi:MAG: phosphoribosylformylglycinamidine cyclo-ligase [Candidatus Omnitrophica bacterium]|nr:phosphoribosylformylglycinamidine cyclo-ligase [Candidatus Omnitrophota bacterium]